MSDNKNRVKNDGNEHKSSNSKEIAADVATNMALEGCFTGCFQGCALTLILGASLATLGTYLLLQIL